MSLMDTLKGLAGKGREVAAQNAEKIESAVDKAGRVIDDKTKGKYSSQIEQGKSAVKNAIHTQTQGASGRPAPGTPADVTGEPAPAPEPSPAPGPEGEQPKA